jgi:hypothetical protein
LADLRSPSIKIGYKLLRKRKDGTLGSLFIGRSKIIPKNGWLYAEDLPTKGYAHRPGWHILEKPKAPHLSLKNRVWCRVMFRNYLELIRPENQGGKWFLAQQMYILEEV